MLVSYTRGVWIKEGGDKKVSMLIQIDNINQCLSYPIDKKYKPEELRNLYGSRIEGERVVVYDYDGNKYVWTYINGKYEVS